MNRLSTLRLAGGILLLMGHACLLQSAETPRPPALHPEVVLTIRIENLDRIDTSLEAYLKQVNPQHTLRAPVHRFLAHLQNQPDLVGLPPNAWMEILYLSPQVAEDDPLVFVFPVTSRREFLLSLRDRAIARDGTYANGILRYRAFNTEGETFFGLAFIESNGFTLAVRGRDPAGMARIQQLYSRIGEKGLLSARGRDLAFQVDVNRFMAVYAGALRSILSRIRDDVLHDVDPHADPALHPVAIGLERFSLQIQRTLGQIALLEGGVRVSPSQLTLEFAIGAARNERLYDSLANHPRSSFPLLGALPPSAISYSSSLLWPEIWRPLAEEGGTTLSTISSLDAEAVMERAYLPLLDALEAADPAETLSALVPVSAENPDQGLLSLTVLRFAHPERLAKVRDAGAFFLEPEQLPQILLAHGAKLATSPLPDQPPLHGAPVFGFQMQFRITGTRQETLGPAGHQRLFLGTLQGSDVILVSRESKGTLPAQIQTMRTLLSSTQEALKSPIADPDSLAASLRPRIQASTVRLGQFALLPYIRFSLHRMGRLGDETAPGASNFGLWAEQFDAFPTTGERITTSCDIQGGSVLFRMHIPSSALRATARAALSLPPADIDRP